VVFLSGKTSQTYACLAEIVQIGFLFLIVLACGSGTDYSADQKVLKLETLAGNFPEEK